jgi:hypothetical protein
VAEALGKLLGNFSDEVATEIDFETQPESFDRIEHEVMPIKPLGLVPAGVVHDEHSAFGVHRGDLFCQMLEVILKDIGAGSIKNQRAFALHPALVGKP